MNPNIAIQKQSINDNSDSYKKGYLFEQFVIKLFNEKKFKLHKHRKSKRLMKEASLSYKLSYPDLELIFLGKNKYFFAVECKWRNKPVNGLITWAKDHQIKKYNHFRLWQNMPVFIAIGVGGHPSNPEKLYITPLEKISGSSQIHESDLMPYKRKPTHRFFYDTVQLKLF